MHERQQELYFVHSGEVEIEFGDGTVHVLGPGGLARVDAPTVRMIRNRGPEDAVYVIVGAEGGYVGRDGKLPEGDDGSVAPDPRQAIDAPTPPTSPSRPPSGASSSGSPTRCRPRSTSPGSREGMALVSAMHITAGVWINDDEPGIQADALEWLDKLAPPSLGGAGERRRPPALTRPRRLPPPPRRRGQRRRPPEEPARPPPGDRPGHRGQARPRPLAGDLLRRVRRPPAEAARDQGAGRVASRPARRLAVLSPPSRTAGTA